MNRCCPGFARLLLWTGALLVTPGEASARQVTGLDLVPVPVALDTLGPTQGTIAVSTRGVLAFTPPAWEGETTAMLRILDPGRGTRFLGVATGKGPGEISVVLRWFFEGDSLLHAFDPTTLRISTYSATGEFRRSHQLTQVGLPVRIADDSVDLASGAGLPWSLVRLSLTTGGSRTLLDAPAPGFDRLFPLEPGANAIGARRQPAVLPPNRSSTETVLANDLTYAMMAFAPRGTEPREGGRAVRPRRRSPEELERAIEDTRKQAARMGRGDDWVDQRVRTLRTEDLAFFHFTHGLARDGAGRIWAVGIADGGEEVFADVFSPDLKFLTRHLIPFPAFGNGWDLNGNWLVLLCGRDPETARSTIRLFRLAEGKSERGR